VSRTLARQTTHIAGYTRGHDYVAAIVSLDLLEDGTVVVHTLDGLVSVRVHVDRASMAEQAAAMHANLELLDDSLEAGDRSRRVPANVPDLGDDPDGDLEGYDGA
jgi:hypothetical protein